jgi:hypothetical protein
MSLYTSAYVRLLVHVSLHATSMCVLVLAHTLYMCGGDLVK